MRLRNRVAAIFFLLVGASPARADDELGTQREIRDMIPSHHSSTSTARDNNWAVLPEAGYSPDQSFNGGFKFTGRDLGERDATVDLELNAAVKSQLGADATLIFPKAAGDNTLGIGELHYYMSPKKYFFGIGNNRVRDPISVHKIERQRARATFGWNISPNLMAAFSIGIRQTRVARGPSVDGVPQTKDAFPNLAGSGGGKTNPLIASLVYNERGNVTRPTRGASGILAVEHVNQNLGNDFHFTKVTMDVSYLYPVGNPDHVLGAHVGGEFINGRNRFVPFFELSSLGGAADMRGFFPDRFLGRAKLITNAEYRGKMKEFTFRKMWDIQLDGVLFLDVGQVFISDAETRGEFRAPASKTPAQAFEEFRFSYGTGLRVAVGDALVARLDVGFSNEQTGLVYLVFGHTF